MMRRLVPTARCMGSPQEDQGGDDQKPAPHPHEPGEGSHEKALQDDFPGCAPAFLAPQGEGPRHEVGGEEHDQGEGEELDLARDEAGKPRPEVGPRHPRQAEEEDVAEVHEAPQGVGDRSRGGRSRPR